MKAPNLGQKIVLGCFLAVFIGYLDRINISVAILAMEDEFGWSAADKGIVLSVFAIGYTAFHLPGGWAANRWGGRIVLAASVIAWSVATLVIPTAAALSFAALIVARIALGLGEAAMLPAIYNLLGRWVPDDRQTRASALILSAIPAGTIGALLVSGWIIERWGWPALFHGFGLLGIVWALWWFWAWSPGKAPSVATQQPATETEGEPIPWRALLRAPPVWALFINHFCSAWAAYIIIAWLPSYLRDTQGVSISGAGLLSIAPWIAMFVAMNAGGWIGERLIANGLDRTAVRKAMQTGGLAMTAACYLAVTFEQTQFTAVLLLSGVMLGSGICYATFPANALDLAPRHAGVLQGLAGTFGQLPGFAAVAVTGWLVESTGSYASAFYLAAAICGVGAAAWLAFASGRPLAGMGKNTA